MASNPQQAMFGPPPSFGTPEKPSDGKPAKQDSRQPSAELSTQMLNLSRRLRVLEERYLNLRKKTALTDTNMLKHSQDTSREFKLLGEEVTSVRKDLIDLKDKMKLFVRELKNCATSEEVGIIKNYLEYWDPVEFVTRREVKKIVEDAVEDAMSGTPVIEEREVRRKAANDLNHNI